MRRVLSAVPGVLLAAIVVGLYYLGQTWVLTALASGLLLAFGALWPALWVASLVKPRERHGTAAPTAPSLPSANPLVTILVPARNEAPVIAALVSQIRAQDYSNWQLLVVANNCNDGTAALARTAAGDDARVEIVEATFADGMKADALNLGLYHARGSVIVEIDADNHVGPTLLGEVARLFDDLAIDACQTQIRAGNASANMLAAMQDLEFLVFSEIWNKGRRAIGLSSSIGGTGFAIRTALIRNLGGWRRELVEDFDLHMRLSKAGAKVAYLDSAVVLDEKPVTWTALFKQRRRWMRGHLELAARHDESMGRVGLIDRAYLYSPLLVGLSVALFAIGQMAVLWPRLIPTYAYLSPWFWLMSLTASAVSVTYVAVRSKAYRLVPLVLPYVLVFSFHWIIVLAFSLVRPSWALTKTEHGVKNSKGIAWSLGVRGWGSGALGTLVVLVAVVWLSPLAQGLAHAPNPLSHPVMKSGHSVATAEANSVDGVLQGAVHDSDSAPVANATVTVDGPANGAAPVHFATHTSATGRFLIGDLPPGTYTIVITADPKWQQVSSGFEMGSTGGIWIDATLSRGTGGLISLPLWY